MLRLTLVFTMYSGGAEFYTFTATVSKDRRNTIHVNTMQCGRNSNPGHRLENWISAWSLVSSFPRRVRR